jgi:hypothetical protein
MLVLDELVIPHAEWRGGAQLCLNRDRAVFAAFHAPGRGCRTDVIKPQQFLERNQALKEISASASG